MPQKPRQFQSKGGKFGQKSGGFGGRGRGRPSSGEKSFGGGRREGKFSDRPARSYSRDRDDRRSDDRPPRRMQDGPERGYKKRAFGDKKSFGDKPLRKRTFDDRPPRGERSFDERPRGRSSFGDKKSFGDRPYKKRSFDDRGGTGRARNFDEKPRRDFGDRPKRDFGDRPKRDFGDKKPYRKFEDRGRAPRRDDRFEERAPRESATQETLQKLKSARPAYGAPSGAYLYGAHPVTAALLNPQRKHKRLLCTQKSFEAIAETWREAQEDGIALPEVVTVEREDIERLLSKDAVHQELLLDTSPLEEVFLQDIINAAKDDAKIIILDQVTDPHNVGAVLRSAAAFGAIAVIVQSLHAPEITGTLAKSASGAVEHVPIVREVNLSRAIEKLKEAGFFCLGLDERGKETLAQSASKGKIALVLGAEGTGLRRLVAETCDALVKLPTSGPIASLNVSNAAAVALYELIRK